LPHRTNAIHEAGGSDAGNGLKGVDEPGLIIACADYMVEAGRFEHAAEFLRRYRPDERDRASRTLDLLSASGRDASVKSGVRAE
jgi:hypothetical protein